MLLAGLFFGEALVIVLAPVSQIAVAIGILNFQCHCFGMFGCLLCGEGVGRGEWQAGATGGGGGGGSRDSFHLYQWQSSQL